MWGVGRMQVDGICNRKLEYKTNPNNLQPPTLKGKK